MSEKSQQSVWQKLRVFSVVLVLVLQAAVHVKWQSNDSRVVPCSPGSDTTQTPPAVLSFFSLSVSLFSLDPGPLHCVRTTRTQNRNTVTQLDSKLWVCDTLQALAVWFITFCYMIDVFLSDMFYWNRKCRRNLFWLKETRTKYMSMLWINFEKETFKII